eukprot:4217709-Prymnesium_polylepis.1
MDMNMDMDMDMDMMDMDMDMGLLVGKAPRCRERSSRGRCRSAWAECTSLGHSGLKCCALWAHSWRRS